MKKKLLPLLACTLLGPVLFSQVGINTGNPKGIFHINGGKTPSDTDSSNDVVVSQLDGNVAIGHTSPNAKLDILTEGKTAGFKLVDGTQGMGKVLTSDAAGIGKWQALSLSVINGNIGEGTDLFLNNASLSKNLWETTYLQISKKMKHTGSYITLPPGRWQVNVTMLLNYSPIENNSLEAFSINDYLWLRTGFSDSAVETELTEDYIGGNLVSGAIQGPVFESVGGQPNKFSMLTGTIVINNTSGNNKTYYYIAGAWDITRSDLRGKLYKFGGKWGENTITAIQLVN